MGKWSFNHEPSSLTSHETEVSCHTTLSRSENDLELHLRQTITAGHDRIVAKVDTLPAFRDTLSGRRCRNWQHVAKKKILTSHPRPGGSPRRVSGRNPGQNPKPPGKQDASEDNPPTRTGIIEKRITSLSSTLSGDHRNARRSVCTLFSQYLTDSFSHSS